MNSIRHQYIREAHAEYHRAAKERRKAMRNKDKVKAAELQQIMDRAENEYFELADLKVH